MAFTEYFKDFFFAIWNIFLLYFHAIVRSFCAFDVKIKFTFIFEAFYYCTYLGALLSTYDATYIKLLEVQLFHINRCSRCNLRAWHPHWAAVMNPVIQRVCYRCFPWLNNLLISLYKTTVIFGNRMILLFRLVKVEFNFFLNFQSFTLLAQSWNRLFARFLSRIYFFQFSVVFCVKFLFISLFSDN